MIISIIALVALAFFIYALFFAANQQMIQQEFMNVSDTVGLSSLFNHI